MPERIRVLIVDDVQESRENVERLLAFEPDIEIVGTASRGQEAIDLALTRRPDIVLMDVNMPDMDGIQATRTIVQHMPQVGVVMMSVLNEPDVLRRSMLAGAREYLVKPFSLDELLTSVRNVYQHSPRVPVMTAPSVEMSVPTTTAAPLRQTGRAMVISVAGLKGGVGRSTVASNFAVALREMSQKRVALIDGNVPFGDVAVMMNATDGKTMLDAVPYLRQVDSELISNIVVEHGSGVQLLLAPPSPQEAETVTADLVRSLVQTVASMYDIVIIDTRPSFDDINLSIFDASDMIMLLVTMEMTAIKAARQFLEVTDLLGYPSERVRLVLNRVNSYSGIPAEEIGESLRRPLWGRIPEEPGPVLRSINEGVPIVASQHDSRFSDEIRRMARDVLAELSPEEVLAIPDRGQQRRGLMGRLISARRGE